MKLALKNYTVQLISIAVIAAFVIWNPLTLNWQQLCLVAGLAMTIIAWATNLVHKTIASAFLILVFAIFGKTPILEIISFLYSPTLLLIIGTGLLSHAVMNGGLVDHELAAILRAARRRPSLLIVGPYILGLVLVFIIPQAFARVIIMGAVLHRLIQVSGEKGERAKSAIIFNACLAITMSYMCFSNGDIVLNQSAIRFASELTELDLGFWNWLKLMFVPSLLTGLVSLAINFFLFREDWRAFRTEELAEVPLEPRHKSWRTIATLAAVLITVAFWLTESLHGINPGLVSLFAALFCFLIGSLKPADLKTINPHFLIFLTAAFSIGKVLGQAGITAKISEALASWIPDQRSALFLFAISALCMVLHMAIGSSVATLSVAIPLALPLAMQVGYPAEIVTLIFYVIVNIHFILPIHHATMLLGVGKGYYDDRRMLRFGAVMTPLTFVFIFLFYLLWWRLIGVM